MKTTRVTVILEINRNGFEGKRDASSAGQKFSHSMMVNENFTEIELFAGD